jgi:uncharacterized protein YfaS (alpha-2-macroglobulin family)
MKIYLQKVNSIFSSRYVIIAIVSALTAYASFYYFNSKSSKEYYSPDPAFAAYISAFTSGNISRDGSIKIQLAAHFTDSSKMKNLENIFSFSPHIKGTSRWIDERTIEFKPDKNLPTDTKYEVKFKLNKLIDVSSNLETFVFTFQTIKQAFEISNTYLEQSDASNMVRQKLVGTLISADVEDDIEIEKIIKVSLNETNLLVHWDHAADKLTHRFIIDSIDRKNVETEVKIFWDGDAINLDKKGETTLIVPALGNFSVSQIQVIDEDEQYISIRFSDPILMNQDLNGLITINDVQDLKFIIEKNEVKVYPATRISGSKNINVAAGILNIMNFKMPKASVQELIFSDVNPAVNIVGKGIIMPNSDKIILPFESVNINAVDVTITKIFENNIAQFLQVNELDETNELRRVAHPILKKTIRLDGNKLTNLHKLNRFALDLSLYIKTEPGAIYNVKFSFKKSYSLYRCNAASIEPVVDESLEKLDADWDNPNKEQSSWDNAEEYYYPDGYNWDERNNPCSNSFYSSDRWVNKNVLASDLGIIAKQGANGQTFFAVLNINNTQPISGVTLNVLDYQQQLITTCKTDNEGWANIVLKRKAYLLVAKLGNQRGYLRLDDGSSLSLSHFDVSGEAVQKGIKGFLYGERGVWRPGDSLYLTFVLHDPLKNIPSSHPISFELFNPQGSLYKRIINNKSVDGFYSFNTCTDMDAPTGNWTAKVKAGGAVFQKVLKIETVMPNRLKIKLDFGVPYFSNTSNLKATLESKWLHGALARNLKATVDVSYSASKTEFKSYTNFAFDDPSKYFNGETQRVFEKELDENGKANISTKVNAGENAPGKLTANFTAKVFEPGGNFSIDRFSLPYHPFDDYLGVKIPTGDKARGMLLTDNNHIVQIISVDKNGSLSKGRKTVKVKLYKVEWRWWWDKTEENLTNYSNEEYNQPIQESEVIVTNGRGKYTMRINYPDWGRYLLRVIDETGGHSSGKAFYMDWPGWAGRAQRDNPAEATMLTFSSNKQTFQVGEEVKLTIPTGKNGRALVSIESGSRIIETHWVEVKGNQTQFAFRVTPQMLPNIFVHVTLVQPHAQTNNDLPIRLYGMLSLGIEDASTKLNPVIKMGEVLRPEQNTNITVSEASGKAMTYTLAIVDEGLLDLTRFKTPDLHSSFYAKEALGVKTWDMFDYVMGAFGMQMERILSIGGDGGINRKSQVNRANRFKPVVKFIGPYYLPAGKFQSHKIILPQYIGSVKVMVVAGHNGAYGYTDKAVPVRKPLMVLATLPRVLGPNEIVKLPVSVFAMENNIKNVSVQIKVNNLVRVIGSSNKNIHFTATGDEMVDFDLKVNNLIGVSKVKIIATSGSETAECEIELDVRNPNPIATDVIEATIERNKTWNSSYRAIGVSGTNKATLEISAIPPINLDKRLSYLIQYPHGCVEQTTSAIFPQLALGNLLILSPQYKQQVENNIRAGIQRLKLFQTSDGGMSYWPGEINSEDWSTSYAGHFLIEAQNAGYALSPNFMPEWKKFQRNKAIAWIYSDVHSDLIQAYRLYTLALAKIPELGAMNRLKENNRLTSEAKWRLAAAYVLAGQSDVAHQLIKGLSTNIKPYNEMANTFGSDERDEAMILETLTLMGKTTLAAQLVKQVAQSLSSNEWMSTQSTAYSLLALSKYCGKAGFDKSLNFNYTINGKKITCNQQNLIAQIPIDISSKIAGNISISSSNKQLLYARIILQGQPEIGNMKESSNNLNMLVNYKDMNGILLNPMAIEQGTDFVCEVKITNPGLFGNYEQMALSTIFPSGWEIHNNRMDGNNPKFTSSVSTYQNVRDDRVYTYFNIQSKQTHTYYILLNASYLGKFYMPGINCEAMYNGGIYARKAGSWIQVIARKKGIS